MIRFSINISQLEKELELLKSTGIFSVPIQVNPLPNPYVDPRDWPQWDPNVVPFKLDPNKFRQVDLSWPQNYPITC